MYSKASISSDSSLSATPSLEVNFPSHITSSQIDYTRAEKTLELCIKQHTGRRDLAALSRRGLQSPPRGSGGSPCSATQRSAPNETVEFCVLQLLPGGLHKVTGRDDFLPCEERRRGPGRGRRWRRGRSATPPSSTRAPASGPSCGRRRRRSLPPPPSEQSQAANLNPTKPNEQLFRLGER